MLRKSLAKATLAIVGLAASPIIAHAEDLTVLSLEDLMAIDVTSVAKKRQHAFDAAAAVFVVSQDDIRRTKAANIPEILRMVPGMEVSQIDAGTYAVSARGFNGRFANKLLVLIDGRAIYLSAISGILWDQQLVPLENVERIEVVRGPGATLWGANAVNAVINVITKHGVDTLGRTGSLTYGKDGRGSILARYGSQHGDNVSVRLHAAGNREPAPKDTLGNQVNDGLRAAQFGFRVDWEPNSLDAFTLQGDYQFADPQFSLVRGQLTPPYTTVVNADGNFDAANIIARWTRTWSKDRSLTVQGYWDYIERATFPGTVLHRNLFDLDVAYSFRADQRNEIVMGGNVRAYVDDLTTNPVSIDFVPQARTNFSFGGYIQDDIHIIPKKLRISVGSKFEYNEYTGFEYQPSIRMMTYPSANTALWAAVSRAVRTPSRFERDAQAPLAVIPPGTPQNPGPLPVQFMVVDNKDIEAESLLAYEAGIRFRIRHDINLDIATYYNVYDDLLTRQPTAPFPVGAPIPTHFQLNAPVQNSASAKAVGAEISLEAPITSWWKAAFAASWMNFDFDRDDGQSSEEDGLSPSYQISLRSDFDIARDLEANVWVRRVGELDASTAGGYTDLDVNLSWRVSENIEVFAMGENLLDNLRPSFNQQSLPTTSSFIDRRYKAGVTIRF